MKKLAFKRTNLKPAELFRTIQSEYFFTKSKRYPFIHPYCIITDSIDVLTFIDSFGNVDIGMSFDVAKPSLFFKKTPANLNKLIEQNIINVFFNTFSSIEARNVKINTVGDPVITDHQYELEKFDLTDADIRIHRSLRAVYSVDKSTIHLPYFVILPEFHSLKLQTQEKKEIVPTPLVQINFRYNPYFNKMLHIPMTVTKMISNGEIVLPTR